MAQTADGKFKCAAARIGIPYAEYMALVSAGQKFCYGCKGWHGQASFGADSSRYDGMESVCREYKRVRARSKYTPKERKIYRWRQPARDGDKIQARMRVNRLVGRRIIPDPNDMECAFCGHLGGGCRHEYHHHLGYSTEHHLSVIPLCSICHADTEQRGKNRKRTGDGKFA